LESFPVAKEILRKLNREWSLFMGRGANEVLPLQGAVYMFPLTRDSMMCDVF
jgi:hypothetical protein